MWYSQLSGIEAFINLFFWCCTILCHSDLQVTSWNSWVHSTESLPKYSKSTHNNKTVIWFSTKQSPFQVTLLSLHHHCNNRLRCQYCHRSIQTTFCVSVSALFAVLQKYHSRQKSLREDRHEARPWITLLWVCHVCWRAGAIHNIHEWPRVTWLGWRT